MKLHLGCGTHILPDFVNIDIRPYEGAVVGDITTLEDIADNSTDFIYSSGVIQCFDDRNSVPIALNTWHRVLKSGGEMVIEVPTIVPLFLQYLEGKVKMPTLIQGIYGANLPGLRQTISFDFEYLSQLLLTVGFLNVIPCDIMDYSHRDKNTTISLKCIK